MKIKTALTAEHELRICGLFTVVLSLSLTWGSPANARSKHSIAPPTAALQNGAAAEYVPGIVLVKLTAEGATQFASGNSVYDILGPESASFGIQHAEEAFAGHSIMRYSPTSAQPFMTGSAPDAGISRILIIRYSSTIAPREVATGIARSPFVEYAEPAPVRKECYVPNDPMISQQWHLAKIQAFAAWDIERGDSNVVIAIVDNGVEISHPDLAPNLWHNRGEMGLDVDGHDKRTNGKDDDGDGFIDDWQGWDFAGAAKDAPQDNDPSGGNHGVHVAGIAAAVADNNIGVAGIANGCRLMVIKVAYDNDPGSLPFGFQGITYAADRGAKIINCSWGGGAASTTEQEIINYVTAKGSLVVCAAGNSSSDVPFYPASYAHVLSVTGSASNDQPDPFYANYGPRVDVLAPGTNIFSTYNGASYQNESGTSMASPCASGVAALVASHFPTLGPDQIAARVRVTCDPIDDKLYYTYQKKFGFGRVNAYRAVHDANVEAVWIDSVYVTGDDNNNGLLEPGETGVIRVRFKNMLAPTQNLTATMIDSVYGPTSVVQILAPSATIGAMATLATATSSQQSFIVHVSPTAPQNTALWFRVDFHDGSYSDYRYFSMYINPTFVTLNANNIACTVNSRGNEAYNDFPTNRQGVGFTYKGSENLLFEGALVIATDQTHVVDVARNAPSGGQDSDFVMTKRIAFKTPATAATEQEVLGEFEDATVDTSRRLGIHVSMHHYEFTTDADKNYALLSYTVRNNSTKTLKNLFCGIYLDWDIGANGDSNFVDFDAPNLLGWIRKVNSTYPVCGSALVSSQQTAFYALDNNMNPTNPPFVVNDGFNAYKKYTALSSGIGRRTSAVGDVGIMIGGGPVTLAPGQEDVFAFVLNAGPNLPSLQASTIAARAKWKELGGNSTHPSIVFPDVYSAAHHDTTIIGGAKNRGTSNVNATVGLIGPDVNDFSLLTPSIVALGPGQSADVTIRFAPMTPGTKSAQLVVNYGAGADTVSIFGSALATGLGVTPDPLFFDTTLVGWSSSKSLTLTSARNDTIPFAYTITGTDAAAFHIDSLPSPILVGPGGVTFPVYFSPKHDSLSDATMTLTPTIGSPFTVPLTGNGHKPTGVNDPTTPSSSVIVTNYPDPFSTRTQIVIAGATATRVGVYDLLGRLIADLTPRIPNTSIFFDASHLPAGTYYAKVTLPHGVVLRPMNVVK